MTSIELVDFINSQRKEGDAELRHDHFFVKVSKVLGDDAPKFLGTQNYGNGNTRSIYTLQPVDNFFKKRPENGLFLRLIVFLGCFLIYFCVYFRLIVIDSR